MLRQLAKNDYDWHPERSARGPITMVMSGADKAIYAYRNGNPIGRAEVEICGRVSARRSCVLAARSYDRPHELPVPGPPGASLDVVPTPGRSRRACG